MILPISPILTDLAISHFDLQVNNRSFERFILLQMT